MQLAFDDMSHLDKYEIIKAYFCSPPCGLDRAFSNKLRESLPRGVDDADTDDDDDSLIPRKLKPAADVMLSEDMTDMLMEWAKSNDSPAKGKIFETAFVFQGIGRFAILSVWRFTFPEARIKAGHILWNKYRIVWRGGLCCPMILPTTKGLKTGSLSPNWWIP